MTRVIKQTRDENEKLHSINDEPAIIESNGDKHWYYHGKKHRENGPAVIYSDGDKLWYRYDKLHREDGPAYINMNGDKFWYIDGKNYTFHDWIKLLPLSEEEKTELLLSI